MIVNRKVGLWSLAVSIFAILATMFVASPANAADDGANTATCTHTEICFSEFTTDYQRSHRDFWYWSSHRADGGSYRFRFKAGSNPTDNYLLDRATGMWNRDSSCSVKLWDVTSGGTWYVAGTYANNAGRWGPLAPQGNANRNNGHSRCSEGAPPHPFG